MWNSSRLSVVKAICVSEISENKIFQEPMDLAEKSFEAFEGLKTNSWKSIQTLFSQDKMKTLEVSRKLENRI